MRDLPQESWRPLKAAQDQLREFFSLHGYRVLETPVIEPTELFLRKSGGELATRAYAFTDPGGNEVSLRPEYTASVVRHYLEREDDAGRLPVRIQYGGPVFRHNGDGNTYRQFTQVGVELLGSSNPRADAEVLSLSCMALTSLGLSGHHLELGDLGVLHRLLESLGLSERAVAFILGSISDLQLGQEGYARVCERAKQLRLLASDSRQSYLSAAIGGMEEGDARELLHGLLQWAEVGSLGQREPSEVVGRLLHKFRGTDDPAKLQQGLDLAYKLARVKGEPKDCLREVGKLIKSYGLNPSAPERLKEVMGLLDMDQLQGATVVLDFGLARGFAYYTGIVFEIRHPSLEISLGGGGRYDSLARALGSRSNIPALGFAFTLESLVDAHDQAENTMEGPKDGPSDVLVLAPNGAAYRQALCLARELRDKGRPVEMEVCGMNLEEGLSYARARGIAEVISVDSDGKSTTHRVLARPERGRRKG